MLDSESAAARQSRRPAKFTRLLLILGVLIFVTPFIGTLAPYIGQMIVFVIFAAVLVAAASAVSESDRHSRIALTFAVVCVLLTLMTNLVNFQIVRFLQYVLTIGFLAHVIERIVRYRETRVANDTIAALLCGYVLIGVGWAMVYSLVAEIEPGSFYFGASVEESEAGMRFGNQYTGTALYFSFVTLTTLGYGDITPASMPCRMLTIVEALIGQLYLVVLVARMVGLHISHQSKSRS